MSISPGAAAASGDRRTAALRRALPAGPAAGAVAFLVAGAVFAFHVGGPSLWRDEAATLSVARRTPGEIVAMVRSEDLVHALYYGVVHVVLLANDSITAARGISVVAFCLVAVLLVVLGARLGSLQLGCAAAAVLVATPFATRYAQNARSEGLVTLVATAATLLLVARLAAAPQGQRGTRGGGAPERPAARFWPGYAGCVVLLGALNLVALLLLVGHVLALGLLGGPRRRELLRGWALSAGAGVVVLAPFAVAAWGQRGQIAWMTRPHVYDLTGFLTHLATTRTLLTAVTLGAAAVLLLEARRRRDGPRVDRWIPSGPGGVALVVGGLWAVVPPVALWTVSLAHPMWDEHYVVFCLPGWALLVAAVAARVTGWLRRARVRRRAAGVRLAGAGVVAVAVPVVVAASVAVLGLPMQAHYRDRVDGHGEDLRDAAAFIGQNARPGDGLLLARHRMRTLVRAEPAAFRQVTDVALAVDPITSDTLAGVEVPPQGLPAALTRASRIWLLRAANQLDGGADPTDAAKPAALDAGFRLASTTSMGTTTVALYTRR